jgi:hypothetical protein
MTEAWQVEIGSSVIRAHLLILQAKRLMLTSTEQRLEESGTDALRAKVEQLQIDTAIAQHNYRTAILEWASPEDEDFWLVAYSRLIAKGHRLNHKLRDAIISLPVAERYEIAADIEVLEGIVAGWTDSLRRAMATSVA